MSRRWQQVRQRWDAQGVRTVPPATAADLIAFETHHQVRLPSDLREFFTELGGMDPRAVPAYDREGFALWPASEVRPTDHDPHLFVIADYLNWSWAYAIALGPTAEQPHPVVTIDLVAPRTMAHSYAEFIDLYLADSPLLYPA